MKRFVVKKYDGDDIYSYAIFRAQEVKGLGSIIFYGDARPIMSGLDRSTARFECERCNKENKK